jgi:beta-glucosidase
MTVPLTGFPKDFVLGAATAAYQIEGATREDGRGESIWDRFCTLPGKVENGENGDRACEHYVRWPQDLDLMQSLGLRGYRFSISWPRIQPDGRGPANQKGLDFYRRLVEGLLEREIEPLVTLYHWDLPQALEDEGGWASRAVVDCFADYAGLVFDGLDGLVSSWVTHNEPWVTSFLGYAYGTKAPGVTEWPKAVAAAHHALLAHGAAVQALRARSAEQRIGITLDLTVARAATVRPEDQAAALRLDGHHNRWFLDALFRGSYPDDMLSLYEDRSGPLDVIHDGDLELISQPIDFLGVNFYRPNLVANDRGTSVLELREVETDAEQTAMGWPVIPEALTELLVRVQRDYGDLPLLITENGAAFDDTLDGGVVVEDPRRLAYIKAHLEAVAQAIAEGVDVRGYYVWSLLDNFEWEHGYSKRFGIVYIDYASQRRVPKRSALWYRDLIARQTNGRS